MSKIAILLPDGTGLRNYIYSDLIPNLSQKGAEIVLISSFSDSIVREINSLHGINVENVQIPPYKETVVESFYRELEACSRIRRNARVADNPTILEFWNKRANGFFQKVFYKLIWFLSRFFSRNEKRIKKLSNRHLSMVRTELAESLLREHQIDVMFCTHQRAYSAIPLFEAAKKKGIKTYTVIYSWDNMPKGRLPFRPDHYFAWSEWMKDEFKMFYPEIQIEKVSVTGTPQFEFYSKKEWILSREEFCKQVGISPDRRLICYSGDDTLTSPFDPLYLEDLAESILKVDKDKKVAIILRRCPVDTSGRFASAIEKYPNLIYVSDPLWTKDHDGGWTGLYPTIDDVKLLCNIAYHCDAVYNLGSTMAFDFCMFNHPAYFINYDVQKSVSWSTKTIYRFQHFRSMPSKECVKWVNSKADLIKLMDDFVNSEEPIQTKAKEWFTIINSGAINSTPSRTIADILTKD